MNSPQKFPAKATVGTNLTDLTYVHGSRWTCYKATFLYALPTVSATQALRLVQQDENSNISTGLRNLDERLSSRNGVNDYSTCSTGGIARGQVTEVYGPPGVGKTALCIQASVAALSAGNRVVWVDGGTRLCGPRLRRVLQESSRGETALSGDSINERLEHFAHFSTPTMPHLLALLLHAPPSFPPVNTSLVVIDSLSTLFENAFIQEGPDRFTAQKTDKNKWMAGRRQAVLGELAAKLSKLAALRNIAVLVTSNITTKIIIGAEALLRPSLFGQEWETALNARISLFRDWLPADSDEEDKNSGKSSVRFAEVVKPIAGPATFNVIAFTTDPAGIHEVSRKAPLWDIGADPGSPAVRKNKRAYDEIASSDEGTSDSDYGWLDDHVEELAAEGLVDDSCL